MLLDYTLRTFVLALMIFLTPLPRIYGQNIIFKNNIALSKNDTAYYLVTKAEKKHAIRKTKQGSIVHSSQLTAHEKLSAKPISSNTWKMIGPTDYQFQGLHPVLVQYISDELFAQGKSRPSQQEIYSILYITSNDLPELLNDPQVVAVQWLNRNPYPESIIRQHDLGVNGIRKVQITYPNLTGADIHISVKENAFQIFDFDIEGRSFTDTFSSPIIEDHATDMATLIGGSGVSGPTGKGVTHQSQLYSTDFLNLVPESSAYYTDRSISLQNHSYGVSVENFYGIDAQAYDQSMIDHPTLIHIFSLGNQGQSSGTGNYEGVSSFATLTGSFKQAKNVFLVSSTDSLGNISTLNSRGPAYDGRIKPELVAFGGEGTSEGAALVTGSAAILQNYFKQSFGVIPESHWTKAILITGSRDIMQIGPDYISGFGELDIFNSLKIAENGQYFSGTLTDQDRVDYTINIPESTKRVKVVLHWNDLPANAGDEIALINDLDIQVTGPSGNFLPLILATAADSTLLSQPAQPGFDRINTTESIWVESPISGEYTISISGYSVEGSQAFTVAYDILSETHFEWNHPVQTIHMDSSASETLLWRTQWEGLGALEVRDQNNNWVLIDDAVDLSAGRYTLEVPNIIGQVRFRMVQGMKAVETDEIIISAASPLQVELLCDDLAVVRWNTIQGHTYTLSNYNKGELVNLYSGTDTTVVIDRTTENTPHYTMYSRSNGLESYRSSLLNIEQQGTGCFLNSFTAGLNLENQVRIRASWTAPFLIKEVRILKALPGEDFGILSKIDPDFRDLDLIDEVLVNGIIKYKLEIETADGAVYKSQISEIYYTDKSRVIHFPNPVENGSFLILSPEVPATFTLFDRNGRKLKNIRVLNDVEEVFVSEFPSGLYLFRLTFPFREPEEGKVIIRGN